MTISPAIKELAIRQINRPGTHVATVMDRYSLTRTEALLLAAAEGYDLDEQDRFIRKPTLAVVPPIIEAQGEPEPSSDVVNLYTGEPMAEAISGDSVVAKLLDDALTQGYADAAARELDAVPEYDEPEPPTIGAGIAAAAAAGYAISGSTLSDDQKLVAYDRVVGNLEQDAQHFLGQFVVRAGVADLLTEAGSYTDNPHIQQLLEHAERTLDTLNAAVLRERQVGPLRRKRQELLEELASIDIALGVSPVPWQLEPGFMEQQAANLNDAPVKIDQEFVRSVPGDADYHRAVRQWCQFNDIPVSVHGRVNQAAIDAYEAWWTE